MGTLCKHYLTGKKKSQVYIHVSEREANTKATPSIRQEYDCLRCFTLLIPKFLYKVEARMTPFECKVMVGQSIQLKC